jgi:hypothetical protein
MSRITGFDAANLIEAYNAVYAPQEEVELTEEQIQEDFENWVNSLVEEGHDLSEYTWEEMYEEYIQEQGRGMTTGQMTAPISNTPYRSRFARPMNAGTSQQTGRGTAVSRPQIGGMGGLGVGYRGAELQQAARARASQVGTPRQGTAGGPTTGGNTPIAPTRPAPARPVASAPASTRPVATAPARPAATAPAAPRPTPAATAPSAPAAPRPSLAQQTAELRKMRQASQQRQIAQGGTPATPLVQSFDPFDIVMGYLIDEGYAESEEAAAVIMVNMSEEWRQEILEGKVASETMGSDERRRERNDRYREENPTLPSGNPTGVNAQLMRQMAHAKKRGVKKKKN